MLRAVAFNILVLALLQIAPLAGVAHADSGLWLVTAEEAMRAKVPQGNVFEPVAAKVGPGPEIVVKTPRALERIQPPVDILVTFEPGKSGLPPVMDTFKATLIGFFDVDLTDRVREYIKGNQLDVKDAKLPNGNHRIRLTIRDTEDNANERDLTVKIVSGD